MSAGVVTILTLVALYILGRRFEHHGHRTGVLLTPSRIEHFDEYDTTDDEGMDTFAAIWNEGFVEDELERLWNLPTREHA